MSSWKRLRDGESTNFKTVSRGVVSEVCISESFFEINSGLRGIGLCGWFRRLATEREDESVGGEAVDLGLKDSGFR